MRAVLIPVERVPRSGVGGRLYLIAWTIAGVLLLFG